MIIPTVIEQSSSGTRVYDIYSRLLNDRIMFLGGTIDDSVANLMVAQILLLDSKDNKKPMYMYINSSGGSVTAALAILDTMNHAKTAVATVCVGLAASAGALLLSAGEKGQRSALKNAEIMIHQPILTGVGGQMTDISIVAKRGEEMKDVLSKILSENTGQDIEKIKHDVERDYYMSAKKAKQYGIIDKIHN